MTSAYLYNSKLETSPTIGDTYQPMDMVIDTSNLVSVVQIFDAVRNANVTEAYITDISTLLPDREEQIAIMVFFDKANIKLIHNQSPLYGHIVKAVISEELSKLNSERMRMGRQMAKQRREEAKLAQTKQDK